jgi:hypothetical protein
MKAAPVVLPQKGISVTATKKESLPSGTEVLWGTPRSSPVFMIKFCEAQSPNEGMPPVWSRVGHAEQLSDISTTVTAFSY